MPYAIAPEPITLNADESRWDIRDPEWEMLFWPRIMWGDMGTFSGVSVVWFDPKKLFNPRMPAEQSMVAWWSGFLSGNENMQAREFLRLARGLNTAVGLAVGLEKFVVQSVRKEETFLSSPRIAAKIDFGLWSGIRERLSNGEDGPELKRRTVLWQMPSDIDMTDRGNERLKQLGMYVPGMDHRNDSTKHCILHLRKMSSMALTDFQSIYGWDPDWLEDE